MTEADGGASGQFGATVGVAFTVFVLVSAFWFWERTFGGLVSSLWNAGLGGVVALAVLVAFLASPIIRGAVTLVRAFARQIATWSHTARFRARLAFQSSSRRCRPD